MFSASSFDHGSATSQSRYVRLDLARQPQHLDALGEQGGDALEALAQVRDLQKLLLLRRLHVEEARDGVGERRRRLDRLQRVAELGRRLRQQRDCLHGLLLQVQRARLDLRVRAPVSLRYSTRATR
jgi:hypothetical protein